MRIRLFLNRIALVLLLSIVSMGILASPAHAQIDPAGWINDGAQALVKIVFFTVLDGLKGIASWILGFSADILSYVMGDDFNSTIIGHPFVQTGWEINRDIANMFFIVILIMIAAGTILRLESYGVKRLLPSLIIIALLINFSNVLVGFVVDISQIFMSYFLEPFDDTSLATRLVNTANFDQMFKAQIIGDADSVDNWTEIGVILFAKFLDFLMLLYAALILLGLALLYVVRIVVLWIVAILAPIAFISWILPATRGRVWNQWWDTLIKWSIFGPIATFFLFLAASIMEGMASFADSAPTRSSYTANLGGFWGDGSFFLQAAATFILLTLSVKIGMSSAGAVGAKIANTITGYAAGVGLGMTVKPARWTGRKAVGAGRAGARAGKRYVGRKAQAIAAPRVSKLQGVATRVAKGEHTLGQLPLGVGAAFRVGARQVIEPLTQFSRMVSGQVNQVAERTKGMNYQDRITLFNTTADSVERMGHAKQLYQEGRLSEVFGASAEQIRKATEESERFHQYDLTRSIETANPHIGLTYREAEAVRENKAFNPDTYLKDLLQKMTPARFAGMSSEALKDARIADAVKQGIRDGFIRPEGLKAVANSSNLTLIGSIRDLISEMHRDNDRFSDANRRYLEVNPQGRETYYR